MESSELGEHNQEAEQPLAGEGSGEDVEQKRVEIQKQQSELDAQTGEGSARDAAARDGEDVNLGRPGF